MKKLFTVDNFAYGIYTLYLMTVAVMGLLLVAVTINFIYLYTSLYILIAVISIPSVLAILALGATVRKMKPDLLEGGEHVSN